MLGQARSGSNTVAFKDLFGVIKKSAQKVIRAHTHALKRDIQTVWPVKSGASKAGWSIGGNQHGWSVYNSVRGERDYNYVVDLWYGSSQQLPAGGDPIVRRRKELLLKDLQKMQFNPSTGGYTVLRRAGKSPIKID